MQGNSSNLQISHEKNANKRKNPLTPVKLESKKQDKKVLAMQEGSGWEVSIERQEEATSKQRPNRSKLFRVET